MLSVVLQTSNSSSSNSNRNMQSKQKQLLRHLTYERMVYSFGEPATPINTYDHHYAIQTVNEF